MREYLLYSQIPAAREEQVLSILAGLSGVQPVPINEHVVLYAQLKAQEVVSTKKQSQTNKPPVAKPLLIHKLVRGFDVDNETAVNVQPWTFRAESVPDGGVTGHIARSAIEHLATNDELARVKQAQLYRFKRQFVQAGNRFVHNNIIIKVVRLFGLQENTPHDPIETPPIVPSKLKPVDASGTWMIEVVIRVENEILLKETAIKELNSFQLNLVGALDLIAPDRMLLDTRVKNI